MVNSETDPHGIIGYEVSAADGGNYGYRVIDYDNNTGDYIVQAITWSTGELFTDLPTPTRIDSFKISYRYDLKYAIKSRN